MDCNRNLVILALVVSTCILASCSDDNTPLAPGEPRKVGTVGRPFEMVGTWSGSLSANEFLLWRVDDHEPNCEITLSLYPDGRFERGSTGGIPGTYGYGFWGIGGGTFYLVPTYPTQAIWSADVLVDGMYDILHQTQRRLVLRRVADFGTIEIRIEHVSLRPRQIWPEAEWPDEWFILPVK